ncbi:MAG: DSD1 family PLP-dependent enzyme [Rhizomicrobium sp.]
MTKPSLNAHLVGVEGGRWRLNTPALIVDLDAFERNLAAMAVHGRSHGIALRPHAKSHKSVAVARRQIAAGAIGQCCAKLGEAEALTDGGISSILITSPIVAREAIARLVQLNARADDLMLVVDSRPVLADLARALAGSGRRLKLLVDIDVGLRRTGIVPGPEAYALAEEIAANPAFEFAGIQGYAGHLMHVADRAERRARSLESMSLLREVRDVLTARNLVPRIVTGGGTGTFDIDPAADVLTELQAGSYAFMDREYNDVWHGPCDTPPFETALFVQTTVISANATGLATTDAGYKAFATDAGPPAIAAGAPAGAAYFFFGDEHGGVTFASDKDRLAPGQVLTCIVPHCDPTVNLYEHYHVVRDGRLVEIWPIEARGASQ